MISVIIPALNEEKTIGNVVRYCRQFQGVTEVIVVDDQSFDDTVENARTAGAKVITSTRIGKGASMKDGLLCAKNELIVFLDGDIDPYPENLIPMMSDPIRFNECDFVKTTFTRNGGRVTELVAKPLLSIFFPELSHYTQPLGGMIAGRKEMLQKMDFLNDFGVDIGILIDMHEQRARIIEVNIGYIENDSKPLKELGKMSKQVASAILLKALRNNSSMVSLEQFQSINIIRDQMELVLKEQERGLKKMIVFDMDDTLLKGRFIDTFAAHFGLSEALTLLRNKYTDPLILTKNIAKLLKGYHIGQIIEIIESIPIVSGAKDVIASLKENGFAVGIITDSYNVVASHIKKSIGADFSLANELEFSNSQATGEVKIPSFFFEAPTSSCSHTVCKSHAMNHILHQYKIQASNCIAVGDSENDLCMIKEAGLGIAFRPKNPYLKNQADLIIIKDSFDEILSDVVHQF